MDIGLAALVHNQAAVALRAGLYRVALPAFPLPQNPYLFVYSSLAGVCAATQNDGSALPFSRSSRWIIQANASYWCENS